MALPQHLKYRPDIDGLRTIAVFAVIVFHAFPLVMPGGFIGVDIFFVISGYLITCLILKEGQQTRGNQGTFNLADFYARRVRRIFPALIIVLIFCLVSGWFFLLADEYKELGKETLAGAVFIENISLWQDAGYFDTAAEHKPLLHLWSLGVEEQFYLAWPILLILAIKHSRNITKFIIAIAAISFIANIALTKTDVTAAFYLPVSRIWQFMAGAMLARTPPTSPHFITKRFTRQNICSAIGGVLILTTAFTIDSASKFPGWWALLPTVGAYLIISAGPHAGFNRHILGSRLFVRIGLISYPLYLWHWPLLYFTRIFYGETPSVGIRVAAIALSLVLAYLTYIIFELRLRFREHYIVTSSLIITIALLAFIGHNISDRDGLQFRLKGSELERVKFNTALSYQNQCRQNFPFAAHSFCLQSNGEKPPAIALIGDSHAQSLFQGLGQLYSRRGESLVNFGAGGGIPLSGVERSADGDISSYGTIFEPALEYAMVSKNIKTIILMNKSITTAEQNKKSLSYKPSPNMTDPIEIYGTALAKTLEKILAAHKQVIFVIDNPSMDFDPASCLPRPPSQSPVKSPCAIPRPQYDSEVGQYRKKIDQVLSQYPEVKKWDISSLLCDAQYCWAMKDGTMLYNRDGTHLSIAGSHWLANQFPY